MMDFMPHGECINWDFPLLAAYVAANSVIFLSYVSLPSTLVWLAVKGIRNAHVHENVEIILLIASFGFLCAATHLSDIITVWVPAWYLDVAVRVMCAVVSLLTAIRLPGFIKKELGRPSNEDIKNKRLELEELMKALDKQKNDY